VRPFAQVRLTAVLGHGGLQFTLFDEAESTEDFVVIVGGSDGICKLRKYEVPEAEDFYFKCLVEML